MWTLYFSCHWEPRGQLRLTLCNGLAVCTQAILLTTANATLGKCLIKKPAINPSYITGTCGGKKRDKSFWTHTDDIISVGQKPCDQNKTCHLSCWSSPRYHCRRIHMNENQTVIKRCECLQNVGKKISAQRCSTSSHPIQRTVKLCDNDSHHSDLFVVGCRINDGVDYLEMIRVVFA